jgi:ferredoxin-NADP reductase/Na+-translocating ferredoxin:NAD+ oxidoreductase RnfD subunit
MKKYLDNWLNNITMYRLILYYLIFLLAAAEIFSIYGLLPYQPLILLASVASLLLLCATANLLFSVVFNAPRNVESVYITALILALIITPTPTVNNFIFLGWAAILAMGSKYLLAINKKHIFNPAAIAVLITSLAIGQSASWWVGTAIMAPWVFLGGLLIVRKIRRSSLVISFLASALATISVYTLLRGGNLLTALPNIFLITPLFFLAFVMLTEPLTTPPTKGRQIIYGLLTGCLFAPANHLGNFYSTPELALVLGNIYSYAASPKAKLILKLKKLVRQTPDTYDLVFVPEQPLTFLPGQYLEWTLEHPAPDNRGNRRYFTIASSPTEDELIIGVKFYNPASSFKRYLWQMIEENREIVASQLAGDFTLPADPTGKYVFIAGGIGVTPFRSMIKYLADNWLTRDIVMLYSNRKIADIAYKDLFDHASQELGLKMVYTLTDASAAPSDWPGQTGAINAAMIQTQVPDYSERTFYISGPRSMIDGFSQMLRRMGVAKNKIKTDFFPGFA